MGLKITIMFKMKINVKGILMLLKKKIILLRYMKSPIMDYFPSFSIWETELNDYICVCAGMCKFIYL